MYVEYTEQSKMIELVTQGNVCTTQGAWNCSGDTELPVYICIKPSHHTEDRDCAQRACQKWFLNHIICEGENCLEKMLSGPRENYSGTIPNI